MAETSADAPAPATASPKGKKATKAAAGKKKAVAPSHPPVAQMVVAAVKNLKERGGSSTQAIKKYITSNYKVDAEKKSKFIAKYLKAAVTSGTLIQTKGKGANGSFKLAGAGDAKPSKETKKVAKPAAKKSSPKKVTKTVAKAAVAKKPATASKAKKAKKPPTAPKSPKAKTASKAKAAPKKTKSSPKKKPAAAASKKRASPKKK